jgi:predicted dehydrogenase
MSERSPLGIGVIGLGWMGQAHSRSMLRIPTLFPERTFDPRLVVCADTAPGRAEEAVTSFGFGEAVDDWPRVVEHPDVDLVVVTAPNMLHLAIVEAAAAAGKHVLCEKPVGGTPDQTVRAELAARKAGVSSAVGYNYRWAPLVQEARQLVAEGTLGTITNYRGRFFSTYGADPLGALSWRYLVDQGGYGVSSDLLSHAVDLALFLIGPITEVVGTGATFIAARPLPSPAGGSHYDRGATGDPTGAVTNEDYVGMLCAFEGGARGTFESSRSMVGPESQMAFEVYGTEGALAWNFERMNELQLYLRKDGRHAGYRTIFGGDRFPYHGHFVPGSANGIGFEDLIVIEDYEFCRSVVDGRPHHPSFEDAVAYVSVQAALLTSCESAHWEPVVSLRACADGRRRGPSGPAPKAPRAEDTAP